MKSAGIAACVVCAVVFGSPAVAPAQSQQSLPVAGYDAARDVPGAHELPDPALTYKIVFSAAQAAPKPGDINPTLQAVARYVNTLAKNGVVADHRKIVVVFHQGGTDVVVNRELFKSRNNGQDNPNIPLIQALKNAGVDFRVCGQALLSKKIDPKSVLPEIQVDLWALTTMMNLQTRGYVRAGG
jgi:intracellular sulfur oxidation DsrE/DsrF family protein